MVSVIHCGYYCDYFEIIIGLQGTTKYAEKFHVPFSHISLLVTILIIFVQYPYQGIHLVMIYKFFGFHQFNMMYASVYSICVYVYIYIHLSSSFSFISCTVMFS